MLQDILLTCLHLSKKRLFIEEFMITKASDKFLHPGERALFKQIIEKLNSVRKIAIFVDTYGDQGLDKKLESNIDSERLRCGLYLGAFANGLEKILYEFYDKIVDLETYLLQTKNHSLIFIFETLQKYDPTTNCIHNLLRQIEVRKLHGCALFSFLYENLQQGTDTLDKVVETVMLPVTQIFITQLSSWLLFGKLEDEFDEFFIQESLDELNSNESEDDVELQFDFKENEYSETEMWKYEIIYEFLPSFLSTIWAQSVLFIGQTVLIFKIDGSSVLRDDADVSEPFKLWNEDELKFYQKLKELGKIESLNSPCYEATIKDIKKYVTRRLAKIAIEDTDLAGQMNLIKEFYLMGRGELYLEFWRQVNLAKMKKQKLKSEKDGANNEDHVNYIKAFEVAAIMVGASDQLENFEFKIIKNDRHTADVEDETNLYGSLKNIEIKYKYAWPLNLLFSPKSIKRYNTIFHFLLLIKKIQNELHLIWRDHIWNTKKATPPSLKLLHLRNQIMFFIDNLQYYIQVDVLESQYSILIDVIKNNEDFEEIRRAHSIFQANVLSQCFLLTSKNAPNILILSEEIDQSENPIFAAISDILILSTEFSNNFTLELSEEELENRIINIEERFHIMMAHLIKLLINIKNISNTPLLQLLQRLDFNNWFSEKDHIYETA